LERQPPGDAPRFNAAAWRTGRPPPGALVILVDTSIWIELFNGRLGRDIREEELFNFVTCGPVVQEVLQGLRDDFEGEALRDAFLALPVLSDPLPLGLFLEAARLYQEGRGKGYIIRSSTDCLIAAVAIENKIAVWHRDRDFDAISRFTSLRTYHHA
jgi:predicted nucleic acid-binding protein